MVTAIYTEKLQTVPTGPRYSTHAVGVYGVQICHCRTLLEHWMAQEQSGTAQYLKISNFERHWRLGTSLVTTSIFSKITHNKINRVYKPLAFTVSFTLKPLTLRLQGLGIMFCLSSLLFLLSKMYQPSNLCCLVSSLWLLIVFQGD